MELLPEKPENKENLNVNMMENEVFPVKKPLNSPFKITKLKSNIPEKETELNIKNNENENTVII